MAKYGIGARVVDDSGDEGVVIDKAKGVRRVEYADTNYGKLWVNKGRLTAANDQEVVAKGDAALAGQGVSKNACDWVPKVGDRVRMNKPTMCGEFTEKPGVVRGKNNWAEDSFLVEFDEDVGFGHNGNSLADVVLTSGRGWFIHADRLEPVVAPATTTSQGLTITAGGFYRTRDGRKVGPMVRDVDDWSLSVGDGRLWHNSGQRYLGANPQDDLVAEWVEPTPWTAWATPVAEPVAVAEPTATLNGVYGKPGLVVRCEAWRGELFTVGREYAFDADGQVTSDDGEKWSSIYSGEWSLVEPAAPPAKFRVGDQVDLYRDGELVEQWRNMTITEDSRDGVFEFNTDVGLLCNSRELRLSPTIPIGSTVTFTATGRLSAINENGHMQVTFPGLPAARNSFALPADYVSLAN